MEARCAPTRCSSRKYTAYAMPVQSTPSIAAENHELAGTGAAGHCAIAKGSSSVAAHTSVAAASANPRVRLTLETGIEPTRFEEGTVDLAIRHGQGHWPGLTALHLMDDALFPVAAPTLPGIHRVKEPAHVATLPLIHDRARQGWADWFRAAGAGDVQFTERHSFVDSTDALQAAVCGMGAVLARRQIVEPYLKSGQLVKLPGPAAASRWNYYVVYPSHRRLRPVAQKFVDWLLQEGKR